MRGRLRSGRTGEVAEQRRGPGGQGHWAGHRAGHGYPSCPGRSTRRVSQDSDKTAQVTVSPIDLRCFVGVLVG